MTHRYLSLSLATACLLSVAGLRAQTTPTSVYVGVVDKNGDAVTGLAAADFKVREDGAVREVLKAGEAADPMSIALLVDDSQASTPAIQMIREALDGFIPVLAGKGDIALTTFGERPTIMVDYTSDQKKLLDGAHHIFARPGSGAYLMDAIVEICKGLQKRETARKDIVVLTIDAEIEYSNRHYQEVLDALDRAKATLHVITLGRPGTSQVDEMRNRNQVIAEGTERTGGRRDNSLALTGAAPRMKQLANELAHQYVVTYARPETLIPPEKIAVTVGNPALTVHARTRNPQVGAK
jgi:Ca-activated chloride channel family protein